MATSFTPKNLYQGTVTTAQVTVYTVPANTVTMVRSIQFTNTTGAAINGSVWVGALPTLYINAAPVPASVNDPDDRTLVLNAGDKIAVMGTSVGLNVLIMGAEEVLV